MPTQRWTQTLCPTWPSMHLQQGLLPPLQLPPHSQYPRLRASKGQTTAGVDILHAGMLSSHLRLSTITITWHWPGPRGSAWSERKSVPLGGLLVISCALTIGTCSSSDGFSPVTRAIWTLSDGSHLGLKTYTYVSIELLLTWNYSFMFSWSYWYGDLRLL